MQLGRVRSRLRMLYDLIKGVVTIAVCVSFTLALFTLVKVIRCVAYLTYVDRVKDQPKPNNHNNRQLSMPKIQHFTRKAITLAKFYENVYSHTASEALSDLQTTQNG